MGIDITSHVDCVGYGIGDIGGGLDSSTDDGSIAVCVGARCVWYVTGLSSWYVGDGSLLDTQSNRFCFSTEHCRFQFGNYVRRDLGKPFSQTGVAVLNTLVGNWNGSVCTYSAIVVGKPK